MRTTKAITKLRLFAARVARSARRALRGDKRDLFTELDDAAISLEEAIQAAQHGAGSRLVARARRPLEGLVAAEDLGPLGAPARRLIDIAGGAETAASAGDLRALVDARQAAGDARLQLALASHPSAEVAA